VNETPLEIARKYTRGLVFPASKHQVLDVLERNGAPGYAVEIIRAKVHDKYASPADIMVFLHREA
jgi:hypothetical protein